MSQEMDFEHIRALMEHSDKKYPMKTPTDEKSALSMIDNLELNETIEKKSNTYVSKEFVTELKGSETLISMSNRVNDLKKTIREKIQSLNSQLNAINEEKKFYEDMTFMLNDYQKFFQNV